jgi:hypothetical protein
MADASIEPALGKCESPRIVDGAGPGGIRAGSSSGLADVVFELVVAREDVGDLGAVHQPLGEVGAEVAVSLQGHELLEQRLRERLAIAVLLELHLSRLLPAGEELLGARQEWRGRRPSWLGRRLVRLVVFLVEEVVVVLVVIHVNLVSRAALPGRRY